jgi:hypothetical protein
MYMKVSLRPRTSEQWLASQKLYTYDSLRNRKRDNFMT